MKEVQLSTSSTIVEIENRPYESDSTLAEIEAIRGRVFVYDKKIICLREIPAPSPFSVGIIFDQVEKLGQQFDEFGLLIDVSEASRPNAKTRRVLNKRFADVCNIVSHVSFCTGKNYLINAAIKFVMHRTNLKSYSVVKDLESGAQAIKNYVDKSS